MKAPKGIYVVLRDGDNLLFVDAFIFDGETEQQAAEATAKNEGLPLIAWSWYLPFGPQADYRRQV